MIQLIEYFKERPLIAKCCFFGVLIAVLVWSLTVDTSHAHTWAEKHIPWFWSLFGFISATIIVFIARWFGGSGIARKGDYYDD